MRQITLVAGLLALALVLPGVRLTDCGPQIGNEASAQMFSPEPLPDYGVAPDGTVTPDRTRSNAVPAGSGAADRGTADRNSVPSREGKPGRSGSVASQWQRLTSTLWRVAESVRQQCENLTMSLSLAGMLLILLGVWLNVRLRRESEDQVLCKCGLPQGHCPWCRKGES